MPTKKLPVPVKKPNEPALLSTTVVYAIKALPEGKATPDQQSALLRWLLYEATKYYDMSYRPGGEEENAIPTLPKASGSSGFRYSRP